MGSRSDHLSPILGEASHLKWESLAVGLSQLTRCGTASAVAHKVRQQVVEWLGQYCEAAWLWQIPIESGQCWGDATVPPSLVAHCQLVQRTYQSQVFVNEAVFCWQTTVESPFLLALTLKRPLEPFHSAGLSMIGSAASAHFDRLALRRHLQTATDELEHRVQLRTEELQTFQAAVEHCSASILITDRHGFVEYVNPSFCRITGFRFEEVIGKSPRLQKSGFTPVTVYAEMWMNLNQGRPWRGELLNKRKDQSLYWEEVTISPVRDDKGRLTHFVAVKDDISQRKTYEQALHRLATTDGLTKIPNRRYLLQEAQKLFYIARDHGTALAALMLDIDYFKQINDQHGHLVGDKALIHVVNVCEEVVSKRGIFGRFGGEEFLWIVDLSAQTAIEIGEQLVQQIASHPLIEPVSLTITASLGLATLSPQDRSLDELIKRADDGLYVAKQHGRNRLIVVPNPQVEPNEMDSE